MGGLRYTNLVVQGYSYTYRTYVLQVSQGIALYPPQFALSQSRGGGGRGYRSSSYRLSRFNGPLSVPNPFKNIFFVLAVLPEASLEQCQMVVFVADDLGFLWPGIPDLVTELCPPQDTA